MKPKHSSPCLILLAVLSLICAGCGSPSPAAWNLSLKKVTPASIDVDIVGVQPSDEARLMNMKPSDWWAPPPNNVMRKGYEDMMTSSTFQTDDTWVVSRKETIWKKWFSSGVTEIMVIANLPRVHDDTVTDGRRTFLKLTKADWKDTVNKTIEIHIQDDRVRVMTAQAGK